MSGPIESAQRRLRSAEPGGPTTRSFGAPALFAIALGSVGSAIYFILGVVAGDALGLTPIVFVLTGAFFVITALTYLEGTSLHTERGGASTFARYAFNELWSFVAGWAILLDYLIVMAIGSLAVGHYLAAFWGVADDGVAPITIAGGVIAFVAWLNVRGVPARGAGYVLRLSLANFLLFAFIVIAGAVTFLDIGAIAASVDLGSAPRWEDLVFASVVATVAVVGVESASGLAGDLKADTAELKRPMVLGGCAVLLVLGAMSLIALAAVPVQNGSTELGGRFVEAPVLGVVGGFEQQWLRDGLRYAVGGMAGLVLVHAVNSQMLGLSRLSYSLATNRQIPSLTGRLHGENSTPYVAISIAAALAFGLALSSDVKFLAGLFAFGAMLAVTIAHASVIVLRFREAGRRRGFRVPLSVTVRGGSVPLPAAFGAVTGAAAWVSVIVLHSGALIAGGAWMLAGLALYVAHRRTQGRPLTKRFTIPAEALREHEDVAAYEYGSILVPVFGRELDDDIVGTAGRLASDDSEEGSGGAMIQALYVFEMPMSVPIEARVPGDRMLAARRALARAKEVGEEYEGVEVATAMVRGRTTGSAIVSEAKRRGVEAIVLAAEEPSRIRGGTLLGGRGIARDRVVGEVTRYVVEKAPCKVILTAPPAGEEGTREGVAP